MNEEVFPIEDGDFPASHILGGGFKYFSFSPLWEDFQFDSYFSDGWFNHQLVLVFSPAWQLFIPRLRVSEQAAEIGRLREDWLVSGGKGGHGIR